MTEEFSDARYVKYVLTTNYVIHMPIAFTMIKIIILVLKGLMFSRKEKTIDMFTSRNSSVRVCILLKAFLLNTISSKSDIFPHHLRYLASSWDFGDAHRRCFQFTVLPSGLSSVSFIFTILLKSFETRWRAQGIPIAIFLDDGVGAGSSFDAAKSNSYLARADLSRLAFEINDNKSN